MSKNPVRAPSRPKLYRIAVAALVAAAFLPTQAALAAENGPDPGLFFEYRFHRTVGGGTGEYYEYTDDTVSTGRYTIVSMNGSQGVVHARYNWRYSNSDGDDRQNTVDRVVAFDLPSRRYSGPLTDFDEMDHLNATHYAIWFWIPPGTPVGTQLQALDNLLTVRSRDATVWVNGLPRLAVELTGTGTGARDDIYGRYSTTWTDTYWYDRATGMFLRERYEERDEGTWRGESAGFTWTEDVEFTAGNYEAPVNQVEFAVFLAEVGVGVSFLGYLAYAYRWRTRTVFPTDAARGGRLKVKRLKSVEEMPQVALEPKRDRYMLGTMVDPEGPDVTLNFQPLLWDFARKAKLGGDRVAVATNPSGLHGLAIYNREAKIGTILAKDTEITETLRRYVGAKDFFTEWRHQVPDFAPGAAQEVGLTMRKGDAYNLFDTYNVMRLDTFPGATYDTSLVSRMRRGDLDEVAALAKAAYKVDSRKFIRAQFESGDFGFVARVDGRIVGFGFATFTGAVGRIHTLTVDPAHRNRGVGREILRARLAALRELGAQYVVSEIAEWNLPSMELAMSHGFQQVGKMYVETARPKRIKRNIVRR